MTADDSAPDSKWKDAVLSIVRGATEDMTVKKLRKLVLMSLQLEEDDKVAKKTYKKTMQALEKNDEIQIDSEGNVKHKRKRKKDTKKDKKESKKSKKAKEESEERDDESDKDDENAESDTPKKGNKCPGNPQGVTRLFLGNLPFAVDETSLSEFLPGVTHIKWVTDKETGKFYGSAFIEMDTSEAAAKAVAKSGEQLMGRPVKINFAPARQGDVWPPPKKVISGNAGLTTGGQAGGKGIHAMSAKPDNCTKLFIGNLSYQIDDDAITKFFASVDAEVKAVRWIHHKDSGDFKGVGFVEFWDEKACERAAALNGKTLLGRPIRIDWTD